MHAESEYNVEQRPANKLGLNTRSEAELRFKPRLIVMVVHGLKGGFGSDLYNIMGF